MVALRRPLCSLFPVAGEQAPCCEALQQVFGWEIRKRSGVSMAPATSEKFGGCQFQERVTEMVQQGRWERPEAGIHFSKSGRPGAAELSHFCQVGTSSLVLITPLPSSVPSPDCKHLEDRGRNVHL